MTTAGLLLIALLLDAALGEPDWLWSRLPHPAIVMGRAVAALDTAVNRGHARRTKGALAMLVLVVAAGGAGWLVAQLPGHGLAQAAVAAALLAQRSLADHVRAVANALRQSVAQGRRAVARIVGRDTAQLDPPAIARAAIESAAENLSDGVVAPALWFLVFGLPGLMIYKITNTADSMIGYRTPRHEAFGWAAARLDDVLNWLPARLTALLIALAGLCPAALRIARRDAPLHRSPNAGWPEAAMAAVLGVSLAGPRSYDGRMRSFPHVHATGRRDPSPDDIDAAVAVLWRVWGVLLLLVALVAMMP